MRKAAQTDFYVTKIVLSLVGVLSALAVAGFVVREVARTSGAGGVIIEQTGDGTAVKEATYIDALHVRLAAQPDATVTVHYSTASDIINVYSFDNLVFTPDNWNVTRNLSVSAVDNDVYDGTRTTQINFSATGTKFYEQLLIQPVTVTVYDNELAPPIQQGPSGGQNDVIQQAPQEDSTISPNEGQVNADNSASNSTVTNNSTSQNNSVGNGNEENQTNDTEDEEKKEEEKNGADSQAQQPLIQISSSETFERVAEVTNTIIGPALAGVAVVNAVIAAPIVTWYPFLLRIFLEPAQFFTRRRKSAWGKILDSVTGVPVALAIVRIYDEGGKLKSTRVTDSAGRFGFLIEQPGQYVVKIQKEGYSFPSKLADDSVSKTGKANLSSAGFLGGTVLIDRDQDKISYREAIKRHSRKIAHLVVSYAGMGLGLVALIIAQTPLAAILLGLHVLAFLLFRTLAIGKKIRPWGKVYRTDTKGSVSRAVVRIFDTKYGRLLETQVTDRLGRFGFTVGNKTYRLEAIKEGLSFPARRASKKSDYIGGPIRADGGAINKDIPLDPA